jgi:UDP-N-acetyl-D-glucosamine dehydrogenase
MVAYSPERIDPGNQKWNLSNVPKLVSGFDNKSLESAINFYKVFVGSLFSCTSLEIAETAKLLENSFRFINISFINELSMFCAKIGIEITEVINAAATKPYGFMPFYPSVGIGGHCIPVDPIYLSAKAKEIGLPSRFIDLADDINQKMPEYFAGKAEEKLGGLSGKKILVIGIAYKPNVADTRESSVKSLILGLRAKGATVFWHDDIVKNWNFENSVELEAGYDLAILATLHSGIDLSKIGITPLIDTRKSG